MTDLPVRGMYSFDPPPGRRKSRKGKGFASPVAPAAPPG